MYDNLVVIDPNNIGDYSKLNREQYNVVEITVNELHYKSSDTHCNMSYKYSVWNDMSCYDSNGYILMTDIDTGVPLGIDKDALRKDYVQGRKSRTRYFRKRDSGTKN